MSKNLAIITLHGMGRTKETYHHQLTQQLRQRLGPHLWQQVHVESVYYQRFLQEHQNKYWQAITQEYGLRWRFLRKFMLFFFADAASIEHSLRGDASLYLNVHRAIATAFDNCLAQLGDPNKPVLIIAHSLGCEQISNYIWDAEKGLRLFNQSETGTTEQKAFRRLSSVKCLYSTGCNIPVFKAGLTEPKLFKQPDCEFQWHNMFDLDDALGYPIKQMSGDFNKAWLHDHAVRVGGLLYGWNPLCHRKYWQDKEVARPIAKHIRLLLSQDVAQQ